jgi:NAD(P)H-hydrate repair Nnr-like enzyme with NAD(P)H-hydrate epimerase domain
MAELDDGPVCRKYLVRLAGTGHDQDCGSLWKAQVLTLVGGGDPGSDAGTCART